MHTGARRRPSRRGSRTPPAGYSALMNSKSAAFDELDRKTKLAVTDATKSIYRWGLLLALGGLICSAWIPQIPLRKAQSRVPVAD